MSRPGSDPVLSANTGWSATPAGLEVAELIRARGPITFAQFMQIALYGQYGYYTTPRDRRADYLTSPQSHPEFGACVARCLQRMWTAIGHPQTFAVAEIGAGDGTLMRDVLASLHADGGATRDFAEAIDYRAYDLAAASDGDSVAVKAVDAIDPAFDEFQCVLSNELLDAFPVRRFVIRGGEMLELMVDVDDAGKLREVVGEPMEAHLASRLGYPLSAYPDGYVCEMALGISEWVANVASVITRGYVLTVDYGHPREALYHPERKGGTLRCYRQHVLGSDPFRYIGEQDITAHVDFTYLQQCFGHHGFMPSAPLMSQADFLEIYGYEDAVRLARRELLAARDAAEVGATQQDLASLRALSDPRGLGAFLVAIHGVGVPALSTVSC